MIYMRGKEWDYDMWRKDGWDGWGWEDVMKILKK